MSLADFCESRLGLGEPYRLEFPTFSTHQKVAQVLKPMRGVEFPTQRARKFTLTRVMQNSGEILLTIYLLREKAALLALDGQVLDSAIGRHFTSLAPTVTASTVASQGVQHHLLFRHRRRLGLSRLALRCRTCRPKLNIFGCLRLVHEQVLTPASQKHVVGDYTSQRRTTSKSIRPCFRRELQRSMVGITFAIPPQSQGP